MMSSSTMLGRKFVLNQLFQRFQCFKSKYYVYNTYEHTRHRKKPALGSRYLQNPLQIFDFNAWDNVEWDEEQERLAKETVLKNGCVVMPSAELLKYEDEANKFWDSFYCVHQNRFFKDRHWLFTEFPELAPATDKNTETNQTSNQSDERTIFEIGCGVGNTILPILQYSQEANLKIYGCDFSSKAIEILQEHTEFDSARCKVFELDATATDWSAAVPFKHESIDIIVLIFVLSAIHPEKMQHVVNQCFTYLKPGGIVLLRDYGRYDLAQLRFKPGKCLQENFYVRGDGTRVYFFTQDELKSLFENAGLKQEQNIVDRRLQVNRGKLLKMYRVWIQIKFRKPYSDKT